MGQRHQIYVALPHCYLCNGKGKRPDMPKQNECNGCGGRGTSHGKVMGIHHQWLYGHTAIKSCARFLTFLRKRIESDDAKYGITGFDNPIDALCAVYSCNPEEGYYHNVSPFTPDEGECKDPRKGDNNDGITIIDARDIRNGVVRYAFMSVQVDTEGAHPLPHFVPVSARTYVESYYPVGGEKDTPEVREAIEATLAKYEALNVEVLTPKQVRQIFPSLRRLVREPRMPENELFH